MKKIILLFMICFIGFSPLIAAAQTVNPCTVDAVRGNANKASALPKCVNQIYVWSLGLGVLLALLMMVLGGYYLMTAAGNAEQATKGKEFITSALIGVVILFCAFLLLNQINPDLVNFNLDSLNGLDKTSPTTTTPATAPRK
ncbi:MAG: hypothetical protein KW802_04140 [Candidatus Doudnabacteria bacterium]|nr:hypothetical protein [Candidatus Doudnabacteria bacterium]